MSPPLLTVRDLAARRGDRRVLLGTSFEVGRGEIFGLLGPNGAGKTTIFRILTGALAVDAGEIRFDGTVVAPSDRAFRARLGIVFQEPALDPRLTVDENLRLAARLYGVSRSGLSPRLHALLSRLGVADRTRDRVSTLSGGLRRRVEIARALVHDPDLLVLDEPTTGLDAASFRATWGLLLDLRLERGISLLLTTHRPDEAERCDRLGVLDGGRIVASGTPDDLRARVPGDLVVLEGDDPEALVAALREGLGLLPRLLDGRVLIEIPRAHEWIPRIVDALPNGALRSVSLRRPGLAEAFLAVTGHELDSQENPA